VGEHKVTDRGAGHRDERSFREQLAALHREIYRRNQARIRAAVEGDSKDLRRYEARYRSSIRGPRRQLRFDELVERFRRADVVYLGDYHTLEQAQRSMVRILRAVTPAQRPLTIAVEFVEGRHQAALDAFLAGRIGERTFLRRIEYKQHWPYGDFSGPREICDFAREHGLPMLGIDRDARRGATLGARDRYAAQRITQALAQQPGTRVFCLIGELHLAPAHLPAEVRQRARRPLRQLTIHQNPERIYWALQRAGLEQEAEVVEIIRDRLALNVVPPIVCQHSFLRWLDDDDTYHEASMMRDAFRQQARLIAELLELDLGDALETVQIETFRDLSFLDQLQRSGVFNRHELEALRQQILNSESYYVPRTRLVYLGTPSVNHSSEEAAHFLRDVVAGEARPHHAIEAFYDRAINEALAFFGSKLVNHKRKALHHAAYRRILRDAGDKTPARGRRRPAPSAFEVELARRVRAHARLEQGRQVDTDDIFSGGSRLLDSVAHALGYMLGDRIYYGVLAGSLDIATARAIFSDPLDERGAAISTYFALASRVATVKVPRRV